MKISGIRMFGPLGRALRLSCENRLKKLNYSFLSEPFRNRTEKDGAWRCEFWGKVMRSAILTAYYLQDPELKQMMKDSVKLMLTAQTPDGVVSTYPTDLQLSGWDIWGRKYVLLGMVRYYELIEADPAIIPFCLGIVDSLAAQLKAKKLTLRDCGAHEGLAACSILDAVCGVYRISGEKRVLEFARSIAESGCSLKHNIYNEAIKGTFPKDIGNGKAYEMTSCFQGLVDYYGFDPRPEFREACLKYFDLVRSREIYITGIGGGKDVVGEIWNDSVFNQTRTDCGGMGETCVTTTWLHYIEQVAKLTDDTACFDEAEHTLYNGILGAMVPDGSDWTHCNPTPLIGGADKKIPPDQIGSIFHTPFDNHDCCRAQGPEGIAMAPRLAVTVKDGEVNLNLLEALTATFDDGSVLRVSGNYPSVPEANIGVTAKGVFPLNVRIPAFCTAVELNGKPVTFQPGSRLKLHREWTSGDTLTLKFDLSLKEVKAPDGSAFTAVIRGPLLMAEDSRGVVPGAMACEKWNGRTLVDYAAAGNLFRADNTLTVWFKN